MKRHPALRDLSVDHHHALVQAHRLQKMVSAEDVARREVAAEFLEFWRQHANPHFREEEGALLPFFARWGDGEAEPIRQMLREHVLIRRDVMTLPDLPDGETLRALGASLEAHVRLEERVVFPLIEEAVPDAACMKYEAAITRVAEAIGKIQSEHGRDAFAVLSGASLTTEKCYLMGKFARMCLH